MAPLAFGMLRQNEPREDRSPRGKPDGGRIRNRRNDWSDCTTPRRNGAQYCRMERGDVNFLRRSTTCIPPLCGVPCKAITKRRSTRGCCPGLMNQMSIQLRTTLTVAVAVVAILQLNANAGNVEGFAEPFKDIEISFPGEPGLIRRIHVREGEEVSEGEMLVELDARVLGASREIAKSRWAMNGRVEAAQAEAELRSDRLQKLRELNREGHASATEIRRAETDWRVAAAKLKLAMEEKTLAKLECERIEAQIEQRRMRSPIDGVVVTIFCEEGESTRSGDAGMIRLVQLDRLRVRFPVSVQHAATVTAGQKINLRLPEVAKSTSAYVEVVSPVLDAKSGTVEITCVIDNSKGEYCSGMRCLMEVEGAGSYESNLNFESDME